MKIIDESRKYSHPKDFRIGDIVVDDGEHYLIVSDNDTCSLIDLDRNEFIINAISVSSLLDHYFARPLVRIKARDVELHFKY